LMPAENKSMLGKLGKVISGSFSVRLGIDPDELRTIGRQLRWCFLRLKLHSASIDRYRHCDKEDVSSSSSSSVLR
jgi:hypothetical protein